MRSRARRRAEQPREAAAALRRAAGGRAAVPWCPRASSDWKKELAGDWGSRDVYVIQLEMIELV